MPLAIRRGSTLHIASCSALVFGKAETLPARVRPNSVDQLAASRWPLLGRKQNGGFDLPIFDSEIQPGVGITAIRSKADFRPTLLNWELHNSPRNSSKAEPT